MFARLKQRKLVQWALAYVAAAFALIHVVDVVASRFGWPAVLERSIILALTVRFVVALVIAWYHGEKGRQRVSGPELLLALALVPAIGVESGKRGRALDQWEIDAAERNTAWGSLLRDRSFDPLRNGHASKRR